MTEEKKPFTVSDRRHFTPEGEARTVEAEPAKPPPTPPPAKAPPPAAPSPSPAPAAVEDDDTEVPPDVYPLDFTGLLLSLGTQAAMLLGGGDPEQGGPPPDPEGARAFIGLLDILKEKTQGRRTPEEDQVLEGLLYQLRMEYVTRTQVKGA